MINNYIPVERLLLNKTKDKMNDKLTVSDLA